jgi:hypothetical protein
MNLGIGLCRAISQARAPFMGGDGGGLAAVLRGEQVSGVILAHADRDDCVGAAELAEGAIGL